MKHQLLLGVLCTLTLTCLTFCKEENNLLSKEDLERLTKSQPEYDSKNQVIYYKEEMKYDIKGDIAVPFNANNLQKIDFACQFSFFNYGEDICLFKGCEDDSFIKGIGTIYFAYVLKREDRIDIVSKQHNKKYGDWALVNLALGNNNAYVNDVYMTPLAMKAYKNGVDDSFIFIQFVAINKYMNVLFYGGGEECAIVEHCPENIILTSIFPHNIDGPIEGPGQFWHQTNM